eukprot:5600079-Alexandrium_andersonii.AAC.1
MFDVALARSCNWLARLALQACSLAVSSYHARLSTGPCPKASAASAYMEQHRHDAGIAERLEAAVADAVGADPCML